MKKKKNNNKLKKNLFYKITSLLLIIVSAIFLGIIFYIDILPSKYSTSILVVVLLFTLFNVLLLNFKRLKKKIKLIVSVISIIAILIMSAANFYLCRTMGVLFGNGAEKYKIESYSLIALKSSEYKNLKDVKKSTIGYFKNSNGAQEANEYLNKKVNVEFEEYSASDDLMNDLLNSNIELILVEDSVKNIMEEESAEFTSSINVIYTFTIKIKVESTLKDVDVTKNPFAVYISGIDTYGEISSVSRSDVNIVAVVNPKTNQILLISVPRDYYVQLHGTTGTKDKLTHAGIYGIDMSINTLEDLLDVEINYYLKVNFTSIIDIVDVLGGLDVYSEYSFISYSGYSFKKGMNSVNGEEALDFARTRKAFSDGDRQRGKNQQAIIEAIVRKLSDKSVIAKYNSLLSAIDGKYQTNMSSKKILSLIKMQLKNSPKWNINSYSLSGTDSYNYTYTYNQLLYVMEQDDSSVLEAQELIDSVLNGETLENTYSNIGGSSNKVIKVQSSENNYTSSSNTNNQVQNKEEIKKEPEKEPEEIPEEIEKEEEDNPSIEIPEEPKEDDGNKEDSSNEKDDSNITESEEPSNILLPS